MLVHTMYRQLWNLIKRVGLLIQSMGNIIGSTRVPACPSYFWHFPDTSMLCFLLIKLFHYYLFYFGVSSEAAYNGMYQWLKAHTLQHGLIWRMKDGGYSKNMMSV